MRGAITEYIDVAQIVLYVFWAFFIGLIIYLRREDKREGYPLDSDRTAKTDRVAVQGYPAIPRPKIFKLQHGGSVSVPDPSRDDHRDIAAVPVAPFPGAPLQPTGNPMLDGVGPAAYAMRSDKPELTLYGENRIVPLRVATDYAIDSQDPDPRGQRVLGGDGKVGGVVTDVWVDRGEPQIRYLEVQVTSGNATRQVLLPIGFVKFNTRRKRVIVRSIYGAQFADVPGLANPDQVTLLEEDRIMGYYGGGTLYADSARQEPLI